LGAVACIEEGVADGIVSADAELWKGASKSPQQTPAHPAAEDRVETGFRRIFAIILLFLFSCMIS
jgi:hypothetical protein